MAKCVYDGKGIKPDCEHCIDTIGAGMVCTHDCVIELQEERIAERNKLIEDLADALRNIQENTKPGFESEESKEVVCYITEVEDYDMGEVPELLRRVNELLGY